MWASGERGSAGAQQRMQGTLVDGGEVWGGGRGARVGEARVGRSLGWVGLLCTSDG
jgi:hypothetical protein